MSPAVRAGSAARSRAGSPGWGVLLACAYTRCEGEIMEGWWAIQVVICCWLVITNVHWFGVALGSWFFTGRELCCWTRRM